MKINSQDEYGLRILLRIARVKGNGGLSIRQLSEAEGLSIPNVAKLCRRLRETGYINSSRGHTGGYVLARESEDICVGDVIKDLGGSFLDDEFCGEHSGKLKLCSNSIDCSIRSLWRMMQATVDQLLNSVTIRDLMKKEKDCACILQQIIEKNAIETLN